jgi:hypothetical protein
VTTSVPRCAVVLKTYAWDPFVERQARRLADAAGRLDFFISVDETAGPVGPIPFERVVRFTCADLAAAGLAMRSPMGAVLWWNPDYAHYQFLDQHPDYDYYLFVEYDCVVQCRLEEFVDRAIAEGADLVAMPMHGEFHLWHWWPYQRRVYPAHEVQCALLNVCFHSAAGLRRLYERRLQMSSDRAVSTWPNSELFVPTEMFRAKMRWLPLQHFGDLSSYKWFPPTFEDDLQPSTENRFLHPVLDRRRYLSSMLDNRGSLPAGVLERELARFAPEEYLHLVRSSARRGASRARRYKIRRKFARVLREIELTVERFSGNASPARPNAQQLNAHK